MKSKSEPADTHIFRDSIYDFHKLIKNRKAKVLNFPGASSRQLLNYMDINLEGIQVDTLVIRIRPFKSSRSFKL